MNKHTPGPWASWADKIAGRSAPITGPTAALCISARQGVEDCLRQHGWSYAYCVVAAENKDSPALAFGDTQEHADANARLIAAAPAMYEACKLAMVQLIACGLGEGEVAGVLFNAIADAEGKQ